MLFLSLRKAILLYLTAGVLRVNAAPPDGALNSLIPAFTLIGGNGGSETGRCAGSDLANLKAAYEDMCLMARLARDEIDFILDQAERTAGDGPARPSNKNAPQQDVDNWKRWNRVRATYLSLFKLDPFTKREDVKGNAGEQQAGTPIKLYNKFVRDFYDLVDNSFCAGTPTEKLLICTDVHFKFIRVGTPDPGDGQGRNIDVTHPQCRNVGGIWYSPTMPEGRRYTERPPPNNPEDGPFCNGNHGTLAVTVREWGAIVFCKDGLDTNIHKTITLQNLRNSIKTAGKRYKKPGGRETLLQAIGIGSVTKLEDIQRDGGEIWPVTWLHELSHLAISSQDRPAVDKDGNRLKTTRSVYNVATNQYEDEEVDQKAYGYELARNLALHSIDGMINPDNLAFFALAMFFGDYDWSRGFAMPIEEP